MTSEERIDRLRAGVARANAARAAARGERPAPTERPAPACPHREGPAHDCAYVDARNALIPRAESLARTEGVLGQAKVNGAMFAEQMDALAIEAGIMRAPGPWLAEAKRAEKARRPAPEHRRAS